MESTACLGKHIVMEVSRIWVNSTNIGNLIWARNCSRCLPYVSEYKRDDIKEFTFQWGEKIIKNKNNK